LLKDLIVGLAGKEGWKLKGKLPGLVDGAGQLATSKGPQILQTQT
jgi:hypothetical protein